MLPYETLQDAEIALGRNLTFGETLWFNYSARKSDYILYCHNTLFLFIFYILIPMPWVITELIRSEKIDQHKIQPKFKNSFSDMLDCCRKVMWTFVVAVGPLQVFSFPVIQWIGIRTSLPLPSWSEIFWQLVVYFLLEDYANYWLHRMLHCKWGYEKIHYVHHEYTAPIGFAAPYAHWAEIIILGLASFLGPLIVPGHMVTFWLWFIVRQAEAVETHSGYEFPWSPSKFIPFYGGAIYHDYHHFVGGRSQSNFASVFTYCDYIYGTDKGYRYQKEVFEKRQKLRSGIQDGLMDEASEGLKTKIRMAEPEQPKTRKPYEKPRMPDEEPEMTKKLSEKKRMAEEPYMTEPKIVVPNIWLQSVKKSSATSSSSSVPSSPTVLRKQPSMKQNCLCAPTTHTGSFRCRFHRNNSCLTRSTSNMSSSKLNQLGEAN